MRAETIATMTVVAMAVYVSVGLLFALVLSLRGLERIDPAARGASRGFRWIVVPGLVALWPWLLWRWAGSNGPLPEVTAHRRAARPQRETGS